MCAALRGARVALGCLAVTTVSVSTIEAQVSEQRLTSPSASFPHEFSAVRGLVELPDGRLLIADGLGQALMIVDLNAGSVDTVGRTGQGPEEYRQPDGLYSLPGNSVLLVDLGNGRLTELGPDLSFGETMPLSQGDPTSGMGMSFRIPQDVDAAGHVYYQGRGNMTPGGPLPDSGTVLRWNRETGAVDTLAKVKLQQMNRITSGGPNNQNVSISPVPLSPQDGWAVAPDGRVAIVRTSPYRVDWLQTDGQIVTGPVNEYSATKISRGDKIAYLADRQRNAMSISVQVTNGRRSMAFSRGGGRGGEPDPDALEWPDVMPAFDPAGIEVSQDGAVWVRRYLGVDVPPTFDVFDGAGELVNRVIIPEGRELIAFGAGVVYLVRIDEYDLQWLEVYSLE